MKKRKVCKIVGVFLFSIMMLGCTNLDNKKVHNTSVAVKDVEVSTSVNIEQGNGDSKLITNVELEKIVNQYGASDTNISKIACVSQDILMIDYEYQADKEYVFFNINTGEVEGKFIGQGMCGSRKSEVCVVNDYILIYESEKVFILNENFELEYEVSIAPSLCNSQVNRSYCILPYKKKLIFSETDVDDVGLFTQLCSCDYDGGNKEVLEKLRGPEQNSNYINGFYTIKCSEDETLLFFTGYYYESSSSGSPSKGCIGTYNIESKTFDILHEEKEYSCLSESGMLYYDGLQESNDKATGKIILLSLGEKRKLMLDSRGGSQNVYTNQWSDVFWTYAESNMESNESKLMGNLNCYKISDAKRVKNITLEGNLNQIIIFEKKKYLIIHRYGNGGEKNSVQIVEW